MSPAESFTAALHEEALREQAGFRAACGAIAREAQDLIVASMRAAAAHRRAAVLTVTQRQSSALTAPEDERDHHHDDDVKSFVFRSDKPFNPAKLEDFLGAIVQVYGPKMLRYKGVLNMNGTDKKVIFQGVHQLMGSDLGPKWMPGEKKVSKMVFIGRNLPKDVFIKGLEQCLA